jgi:hypothetical protein
MKYTYGYDLTSTKVVSSYIQEHGRLEEEEICSSFKEKSNADRELLSLTRGGS